LVVVLKIINASAVEGIASRSVDVIRLIKNHLVVDCNSNIADESGVIGFSEIPTFCWACIKEMLKKMKIRLKR